MQAISAAPVCGPQPIGCEPWMLSRFLREAECIIVEPVG